MRCSPFPTRSPCGPQEMSRQVQHTPINSGPMIRRMLAILAGIATLTFTSFAIEAAADPLMIRLFPLALPNRGAISHSVPATLFMFVYTAACIAAGGYVTAWIARRSPVLHALIMGIVQEALTVWAMLSIGKEAPLRNWIGALVFAIPAACLGGMIRASRAKKGVAQQQFSGAGAA